MKRLALLTSGWGKVDIGWSYLSKELRLAGLDVIWASYPLRGIVSIEESAAHVSRALEVLSQEYDHISFIGHSMGGLIGRYLIQQTSHWDCIDSYVSLGTPHYGSPLAHLAPWSVSAKEMRKDSLFLRDLNQCDWPTHIPALSFSGGWDALAPEESAKFRIAEGHVHLHRTTHTGLLLHPRTFLELWGWLTYRVFDETGFDEPEGYESKLFF